MPEPAPKHSPFIKKGSLAAVSAYTDNYLAPAHSESAKTIGNTATSAIGKKNPFKRASKPFTFESVAPLPPDAQSVSTFANYSDSLTLESGTRVEPALLKTPLTEEVQPLNTNTAAELTTNKYVTTEILLSFEKIANETVQLTAIFIHDESSKFEIPSLIHDSLLYDDHYARSSPNATLKCPVADMFSRLDFTTYEFSSPYKVYFLSLSGYKRIIGDIKTQVADKSHALMQQGIRVAIKAVVPHQILHWSSHSQILLKGEENHDTWPLPHADALKPYQKEGVDFLVKCNCKAILADSPGLGKSFQALYAISHFKRDFPLYIICPAMLVEHWMNEVYHWMNDESAPSIEDLITASGRKISRTTKKPGALYEKALSNEYFCNTDDMSTIPLSYKDVTTAYNSQYTELVVGGLATTPTSQKAKYVIVLTITYFMKLYKEGLVKENLCSFIVDESHEYRDPAANKTKGLLSALRNAKHCILCSATPISASVHEYYTQLSLVGFPMTLAHYRTRYCDPKKIPKQNNTFIYDYSGFTCRREFLWVLSQVMLRRSNKDNVVPIERYILRIRNAASDSTSEIVSTALPPKEPYNQQSDTLTLHREGGISKAEPAARFLAEFYTSTQLPFIVFFHNRKVGEILCSIMPMDRCALLTGDVTPDNRAAFVHDFMHGKIDILLCSIEAVSVGVEMTRAPIVFFIQLSWSTSALYQAEGRIRRLSSAFPYVMSFMIDMDSDSDTKIQEVVQRKSYLCNYVLNETVLSFADTPSIAQSDIYDTVAKIRRLVEAQNSPHQSSSITLVNTIQEAL